MNDTCHHVLEVNPVTDTLFELVLERLDLPFTPGDCVALGMDNSGETRPYSIASGVDESVLRFVIRVMPDGILTPRLLKSREGDTVSVSPPFGWFRPGQDCGDSPFAFVATGTGVAPFLSYCRSFPGNPPSCCLYGVRHEADAVGRAVLRAATSCHLAVSRETPTGADALQGRVTDLLDKLPLQPDCHYYLCGLDAMIDEVGAWLEERGVDFLNVHREVFFHDADG